MKKLIIAVSLLSSIYSCSPGSGTTTPPTPTPSASDSTFNGSYFKYSYSGNNIHAKHVTIKNSTTYVNISTNLSGADHYYVFLQNPYRLYGSDNCQLHFVYTGSGTGTYPMTKPSQGLYTSFITASLQTYYDTIGSVTVTHSGTDYIEGNFSGTMYGSGLSVPVTGSFKVVR